MAEMGQHALVVRQPCERLKLMPEYACEMPLWNCHWRDLNLSPGLLARLAAWQRQFDMNFHYEDGWMEDSEREAWTLESVLLVEGLKKQLPRSVILEVDLWPIEHD